LAGNSGSDFLARSPQGCALFVGAGCILDLPCPSSQKRWFYAPIRSARPTCWSRFSPAAKGRYGRRPFGMRSKKRFGGSLEPLTHVLAHWHDKEKQELARLDSFDIISSPLADAMSYPRLAALAYVAEVIDQFVPIANPMIPFSAWRFR